MILAAGESRRMGEPKALLRLGGETFLERIMYTARAAGIENHVIVLGADADKILSYHDLASVTTVWTEEPQAGPIGSIRAGIRVLLNQQVEGALIWHVDRPRIAVDTVRALVAGFRQKGVQVALPVHEGRRGHPVLFGRGVFAELLEAPRSGGARVVVRRDPRRVVEIPVPDPAVLEDIDTPEAYRDLPQ